MFRALIEVGLTALVLSVLPMAFSEIGITGPALWLNASVTALLVGVVVTGWCIFLIRKYLIKLPREAPFLFSLSAIGFACLVGNVYWQTSGPYTLAVLMSLAGAAAIFLAMIYRMFPIRGGEESTLR